MPIFTVEVIIENKKMARDPEGETIARELVSRGGFSEVKSIRAGKYLRLHVQATDSEEAERIVNKMSNTLRLFNPVVHNCTIRVRGETE
ncbi:phosphoribosylformylglycinamidine synthase subunit PurS [Candidatus Bathyarchaeota archaeon]|nr:phosphoribosylformylglycinamidine synthase subunit PurS [Candidatus Bathyarchaeota archaeon]